MVGEGQEEQERILRRVTELTEVEEWEKGNTKGEREVEVKMNALTTENQWSVLRLYSAHFFGQFLWLVPSRNMVLSCIRLFLALVFPLIATLLALPSFPAPLGPHPCTFPRLMSVSNPNPYPVTLPFSLTSSPLSLSDVLSQIEWECGTLRSQCDAMWWLNHRHPECATLSPLKSRILPRICTSPPVSISLCHILLHSPATLSWGSLPTVTDQHKHFSEEARKEQYMSRSLASKILSGIPLRLAWQLKLTWSEHFCLDCVRCKKQNGNSESVHHTSSLNTHNLPLFISGHARNCEHSPLRLESPRRGDLPFLPWCPTPCLPLRA